MPRRTVSITLTYEFGCDNDMACDAVAELERERWYNAALVLDADYVVNVTEYPADGVWDLS